ncbi:hypothetical protein [Saccharopolyspora sp. ASAGF58]|uniref:hypothetical protein n=1 Tax=Saccharopolyspora sp. ASAGF58 TaxID=2719023 RepID=UPI001440300D|nr:hypothetical protein [Saccharopolyspora sp. ASAGF58]QIZ35728.1 hypothetical protein FDZ84_14795 [Saccharopolyspora sp. ASAGF58]
MNAGGPPPQYHYRPVPPRHHLLMVLPPRLARKIRFTCTLIGSLSMPLSIIIGILTVWSRYRLPAATVGTTLFTVVMGGLAAFFYFFSCITLTTGRSFVKDGYLNATFATNARRVLVTLWSGTVVTTGISVFIFTGTVNASKRWPADMQLDYSPPVVAYLVLLVVPCLLSTLNMIIGWRLLRPARGLLRKYGPGPDNRPSHP